MRVDQDTYYTGPDSWDAYARSSINWPTSGGTTVCNGMTRKTTMQMGNRFNITGGLSKILTIYYSAYIWNDHTTAATARQLKVETYPQNTNPIRTSGELLSKPDKQFSTHYLEATFLLNRDVYTDANFIVELTDYPSNYHSKNFILVHRWQLEDAVRWLRRQSVKDRLGGALDAFTGVTLPPS